MDMVRALQSAKSRDEPRRTAETHGARCGAACQRVGLHRTDGPAGADAKSQRESQSVDPLSSVPIGPGSRCVHIE